MAVCTAGCLEHLEKGLGCGVRPAAEGARARQQSPGLREATQGRPGTSSGPKRPAAIGHSCADEPWSLRIAGIGSGLGHLIPREQLRLHTQRGGALGGVEFTHTATCTELFCWQLINTRPTVTLPGKSSPSLFTRSQNCKNLLFARETKWPKVTLPELPYFQWQGFPLNSPEVSPCIFSNQNPY